MYVTASMAYGVNMIVTFEYEFPFIQRNGRWQAIMNQILLGNGLAPNGHQALFKTSVTCWIPDILEYI